MNIGAKIYFDKSTGNVILNTRDRTGDIVETTREQDFEVYVELSERVPETVEMVQLEYGAYAEDYAQGGAITRIDLETLKPLFTYRDPEPEVPQEPRKPLTTEVDELNTTIGTLLLDNANDKATISSLEDTVGTLLFEVAALKGGAG
ncbi:hypothetical protein ACPV3A_24090 [Paenibacillus sp. Dod16]|uniref:hypothetical protein n=1 Tax=Paenibacillus sp. Dod16 TaxID=3416392 RepID=UPI003CE9A904